MIKKISQCFASIENNNSKFIVKINLNFIGTILYSFNDRKGMKLN